MRYALLLFLALPAFAERVLVPVSYTGGGAFGALWLTSVIAVNRTTSDWTTPNIAFLTNGGPCPIPEGCIFDRLRPGDSGVLVESGTYRLQRPDGVLLYVPDSPPRGVMVYGRFGAQPRTYVRSELPIVYERDLPALPSLLLPSVPHQFTNTRTTLRVYDFDGHDGEQIEVGIQGALFASAPPAFKTTITIHVPPQPSSGPPLLPGYADLLLQDAFPNSGMSSIDVTVTPIVPPGAPQPKVWAFVTAVDNKTSEVMTVTPK